jgi:hypothetical protein
MEESEMKKALVVVLMFGFVAVAQADDKKGKTAAKPTDKSAPPGPPKPAPEFISTTKYFIGSWKCDGTMTMPGGQAAKASENLGFKLTMNDFYMSVDGDSKVAATQPMSMMFHGMVGYDPMGKKFMRNDYDSMGGYLGMSSGGWEGDKLVFNGEGMMMGKMMKVRHTMTKHGDAAFTSTFESIGADGKAMPMGSDECKKQPGAAK